MCQGEWQRVMLITDNVTKDTQQTSLILLQSNSTHHKSNLKKNAASSIQRSNLEGRTVDLDNKLEIFMAQNTDCAESSALL